MGGSPGLRFALLMVVAALLASAPAMAAPRQKLAVLGIEPQDGDARTQKKTATLARALTDGLRGRATELGRFELSAAGSKDLLELKLLGDCIDEKAECMAVIGKDLGVELLVYGHIQKKKDGYHLSLQALTVGSKKAGAPRSRVVPLSATEDDVRKAAAPLFHDATGIALETELVVASNAEGATVTVAGDAKGTIQGGTAVVRGLPEGKVVVAIEGNGWQRSEGTAELKAGVSVRVGVESKKLEIKVADKPPVNPPPVVPPPTERKDTVKRPGGTYRALFWTSLVVTGAGVTAFTITGLKVKSAEKDQDAAIAEWGTGYLANGLQFPGDACKEAANDGFQKLVDICDRGRSSAKLSNIFLGVTAVAAVTTGFFLWKGYISPPKSRRTEVVITPVISPKGAGIGAVVQF